MTYVRFVLLTVLLMGTAAFAHADGIPVDPVTDVSDPQCPQNTVCPTPIGPNQGFQFTTNAQGGGIFMGTNESAMGDSNGLWSSLLFTFKSSLVTAAQVSCTSSAGTNPTAPFQSPCSKTTETDGTVDLLYSRFCDFTGCSTRPGLPNNDIFTINLNAVIPGDIWPAGLTFNAYPNANRNVSGFQILTETVPEPGTLTLLGIGLGVLVAKRRFRSQRQVQS
jgi:PEP-CTERM motif-containing protein